MMEDNPLLLVKKQCKRIFNEHGIKLFSPQYLVNMYGLMEPEDIDCICNAFTFLTLQGYFKAQAEIFDEDGNLIWGGDPATTELHIFDDCYLSNNDGEPVDFNNCFVQVSFFMTDKLEKEALEEKEKE